MNYRQMAWTMHRSTHCVHVICNGAGGDVTRQRVQRDPRWGQRGGHLHLPVVVMLCVQQDRRSGRVQQKEEKRYEAMYTCVRVCVYMSVCISVRLCAQTSHNIQYHITLPLVRFFFTVIINNITCRNDAGNVEPDPLSTPQPNRVDRVFSLLFYLHISFSLID